MSAGRSRHRSLRSPHGGTRSLGVTLAAALCLIVGCSTGGDTPVQAAEANVAAKQKAVDDAKAAATASSATFCTESADYITALDRYGDILNQTAPTVGDVTTAGRDLKQPGQDTASAGQAAVEAHQAVATAEQELAAAEAELAAARASATGGPVPPSTSPSSPVSTPTPTVPSETVTRVQQAESEFATAQGAISDDSPLRRASQQFNAAAVGLEMAWLQLYAAAGCLTEPQQEKAAAAVHDYTAALQQDLTDAGYYTGKVDGVYGPTTTGAVEALQKAHGLPVTGTLDKASEAALRMDLAAKGGASAEAAVASTAAIQQTLKLAGYWDGPVDGQWTPALTDALTALQKDLGVPETGTVDAATVSGLEKAVKESKETPTVTATVTQTTTLSPSSTSGSTVGDGG
ncbi:MAG TPA: peptidoglycan-binding domain-containing protein [Intrasporangium sp.]|jgi:Putative peptidoglycan-binding domain-containing protein|uniref:peptidoglycan-binding domain-containing protein n=1 Tax=Intrasporangium sp. TaxID=1925024 RepID=UPI002F9542CB